MHRLGKIKDEINDMTEKVKTEKLYKEVKDDDMQVLSNKVKNLEEQIRNILK